MTDSRRGAESAVPPNVMYTFLEGRDKARAARRAQLFQEAWIDFERIREHVILNYHPVRLYQWGSLLNERHFSEISDIDLAFEGPLKPAAYFRLLYEAHEMSKFPVDIVQLETIMPIHRERIINKGRLVYERPA